MIPKKGDTVRLAGSVTQAEFGLALCDDDGEPLQIDGKIWKTGDCGVYVVIKRMRDRRPPFAAQPGSVARWVKPEEVLEVLEGEARMWPNAAALKSVSDERERGLKRSLHRFSGASVLTNLLTIQHFQPRAESTESDGGRG